MISQTASHHLRPITTDIRRAAFPPLLGRGVGGEVNAQTASHLRRPFTTDIRRYYAPSPPERAGVAFPPSPSERGQG